MPLSVVDVTAMSLSELLGLHDEMEADLRLVREAIPSKFREQQARREAALAMDEGYRHRLREMERFKTMTTQEREAELYKPDGPAVIRADGTALWV